MARQRMVTRTIKGKEVTVLMLNVVDAEPHNATFPVPAQCETNEQIIKYLRKTVETEDDKVVAVTNVREFENLYGMTEADFIANAHIIDKE